MKRHPVQLAAIWSVTIWPALNFMAHNWSDVVTAGLRALTGVWLVTVALGAVGHALNHAFAKRGAGGTSVVLWVVAICLFFGYSLSHDASANLFSQLDLAIPPTLGWIALGLVLTAAVIALRKHEGLQIAAVIFSFSVITIALGELLFTAARSSNLRFEAPEAAIDQPERVGAKTNGADIYYILLDGYAGQGGLREFAGFDNSAFVDGMKRRGFVDATSGDSANVRSNYLVTEQTLGAIFSLDYTLTEDRASWKQPWHLFPYVINGRQSPPLVASLKSSGYAVWQTFNTWVGCSGRHLRCLGGQGSLDIDFMTMAFVAPTPLGRGVSLLLGRRIDGLQAIASHLPTILQSKRPFFVFVHSLLTHPPFSVGADCSPREGVGSDYRGSHVTREAYVDALKCTNSKVIALVDQIGRMDPDAIVVIESDHGSAFTVDWDAPIDQWPESAIRERTSFLNLIKAPAACAGWLNPPLGQVNTARFVLGCARGRPPQFLPQRSYLSPYAKGADKRVLLLDRSQAEHRN